MNRFLKTFPTPAGAAIIAIFIFVHAGWGVAQEKNIPDHSGFKDCQSCHADKYKMWEASDHPKALQRIVTLPQAGADCYACHTAEGFTAKRQGGKVDPADKADFHTITCQACHQPGSSTYPPQLVMNKDKLCASCHSQQSVLAGRGAQGIEDTRSFHSGVSCVSCHMSAGNHYMKVQRPDDASVREDTCTGCHKDNNRKARARQLPEWQELYREAMDPVAADMAAIAAALKEKPNALGADLRAKLDRTRANVGILQSDGSRGAHNLDFSLEILAQAKADLKQIRAALAQK